MDGKKAWKSYHPARLDVKRSVARIFQIGSR